MRLSHSYWSSPCLIPVIPAVIRCTKLQAPGVLLHQLLEVLHRGASAGGSGSTGGVAGAAGTEQCPPGVVEDLLAMMEQLGQVMKACQSFMDGTLHGGHA